MVLPKYETISNIPIPDPSAITSVEIAKAKSELRDEFKLAISSEHAIMDSISARRHDVLATRLNENDKAAGVLSENVNRVPTLLDREASRLEKLFEERLKSVLSQFDAVQRQFEERDIRAMHDKQASENAINRAFEAAKEAVGTQNVYTKSSMEKSETSFTKEIDNIKDRLNDYGGRLDKNDGLFQNMRQSSEDRRAGTGTVIAIAVGAVALLGVIVTALGTFEHQSPPLYQPPPPLYQPPPPLYQPPPPIAQLPQIPQLPQNQPVR